MCKYMHIIPQNIYHCVKAYIPNIKCKRNAAFGFSFGLQVGGQNSSICRKIVAYLFYYLKTIETQ